MADDDRRSEQFIREVDEEFRRAQLKAVWDRFAPLIIGVCVLVVAITAGYRGYVWWQERQAAEAGDRFMAALAAIESGDSAGGEAALAEMAEEDARGYAMLARLRLAGAKAAAGQSAEAIAAYDAVAADANVAQPLRDVARIRAALVALDAGDLAKARERAEPLNAAGNAWRHAAREVLATAAYEGGELQQARDIFSEIQQDAETPSDLWVRSGLMISLIDGRLAAPGSAGAAVPAPAATSLDVLPLGEGEAAILPSASEGDASQSTGSPAPAPQNTIPPQ